MSRADSVSTTNRRLFLASGTFAAVSGGLALVAQAFPQTAGKLAARALPLGQDPVLAALEFYAQVRADYMIALDEYCRIEREHHAVRFYRPKVVVHTENLQVNGAMAFEATSDAEIELLASGSSVERIQALKDDLAADVERHEADLNRIGYHVADKTLDDAQERLCEAEAAILHAVPTTEEGAIELARFAGHLVDGEGFEISDLTVALRTLGDWLVARRRSHVVG